MHVRDPGFIGDDGRDGTHLLRQRFASDDFDANTELLNRGGIDVHGDSIMRRGGAHCRWHLRTRQRSHRLAVGGERPRLTRVLHPQCAGKERSRREGGRNRTADSSKSPTSEPCRRRDGRSDGSAETPEARKGCHWIIPSYDPIARPRRAHARPTSVSAAIRSACTSQRACTASITLTSGNWPDVYPATAGSIAMRARGSTSVVSAA